MKDALGVEILPTDTVAVTAWGYGAGMHDVGTRSRVVRINRTRVVLNDRYGGAEFSVGAACVNVLRRDGEPGFEGNRNR